MTGPTGSGKTTTLAGMIDHVNSHREVHIVTIEDPIEIVHFDKLGMINQREVHVDTDDFATALRGAMRQDPDVILVGEMRDLETVKAAITAAETGHLVMSTLHTVDAQETVARIIDFFPPHEQQQVRFSLAGALRGILCQRLVLRADGRGRAVVMEVCVNTGRVADAIADPAKTSMLVLPGRRGRLLRHADLRPAPHGRSTATASSASTPRLAASSNPHDLMVELRRLGLVS